MRIRKETLLHLETEGDWKVVVALHALVSTAKRAEKDLSIPDQLKQTA